MKIEAISAFRLGPKNTACPLRCGIRILEQNEAERSFLTPQLALVFILRGSAWFRPSPTGITAPAAVSVPAEIAAPTGVPVDAGVPVKTGSFFLRLPNQEHGSGFAQGTVMGYLAVPEEAYALLRSIGCIDPDKPVRATGFGPELALRFTDLAERLAKVSEALLGTVVGDMVGMIAELHGAAAIHEQRGTGEREFLIAARDALDQAASDRRDLERIADRLGMNYTTFRLRFARESGEAPGRYQLRRRMERAAELLSGGASPQKTAEILGYPDIYTFSAQFKRHVGMPPGAYRRAFGI